MKTNLIARSLLLAAVVGALGLGACQHTAKDTSRDASGATGGAAGDTSNATPTPDNKGATPPAGGASTTPPSSSTTTPPAPNGTRDSYDNPSGTGAGGDRGSNIEDYKGNGGGAGSSASTGDPRAQRDQIIDDLYKQYGGSETVQQLKKEETRTGAESDAEKWGKDVKEGAGSVATKADRAAFMARCISVGRGKEPIWGGDERAKQFFQQNAVQQKCAQVAHLDDVIEQQDRAPAPR